MPTRAARDAGGTPASRATVAPASRCAGTPTTSSCRGLQRAVGLAARHGARTSALSPRVCAPRSRRAPRPTRGTRAHPRSGDAARRAIPLGRSGRGRLRLVGLRLPGAPGRAPSLGVLCGALEPPCGRVTRCGCEDGGRRREGVVNRSRVRLVAVTFMMLMYALERRGPASSWPSPPVARCRAPTVSVGRLAVRSGRGRSGRLVALGDLTVRAGA